MDTFYRINTLQTCTLSDNLVMSSTFGVDPGQSHHGNFPTREAQKPFEERQPSLVINPVLAVNNPRAVYAFPPGRPPSSGYQRQQDANVVARARRSQPTLQELWKDLQVHAPKAVGITTKEVTLGGGVSGEGSMLRTVEPDTYKTAVP